MPRRQKGAVRKDRGKDDIWYINNSFEEIKVKFVDFLKI